jgi:TRAP-type mannitol/chloroaromatic compound transport system substrate-binding protein
MHEVAPYIYLSGARQPMEWAPIAVREDLWNKLPEDLKIIFINISKQTAIRSYAEAVMNDSAALEVFRKFGCKVSVLNPEIVAAVEKAAEEVYAEKSAKDPLTAEIVKSMLEWKKKIRNAYPRL